jgi:3-deoxy-7-phosphoheptulonate synthase
MVIVLRRDIRDHEKRDIRKFLEDRGLKVREIIGAEETILGAVGQLRLDPREVELLPGVARVIPISKPYKLASREFKKQDTIVPVGPVKIGGPRIVVVAGPCSVESREQIFETARLVRDSGAVMLRGGAYKPRTSPYAFQGLGEEGLRYLKEAGEAVGMPVVTEIVATDHAALLRDYVDVLQIGARNMQNFELLKRVGTLGKPVILKRGLSATIEEWLMAAEYLLASGADNVVLCERGIRTFETYTRNTLDISAIPVVKKLSHLPVLVDPSHATGIREKVSPMALAAVAAGADGLMVEVHPRPEQALSDGPQSLYPEQFEKLMRDIQALTPVVGKELSRLPEPVRTAVPELRSATGRPQAAEGSDSGRIPVAFQGEHGAYSEIALLRRFGDSGGVPVPCQSFEAVFEAVLSGAVRYGILPIENSLAGSIHENYDLLLRYPDIQIVGETKIRIVHNLIGLPGAAQEEIRNVYSHPQGLAQCAEFLSKNPGWNRIPYFDTAGSVAFVAKEGKKENAAIASAEAAAMYGMTILKAGIETNSRNYTRFVILARAETASVDRPSKASLVFSTPDKPGALFQCMKTLSERGLNMKKLESRPIAGKPWEYMFYIDLEIPDEIGRFTAAIEDLSGLAENLRVLGLYRE